MQTCDHGFFSATDDAAKLWRRNHPEGFVVAIEEFFAHGLAAP